MRSVLTDDLDRIIMDEHQRRHDGALVHADEDYDSQGRRRPELRKHKTMKTLDEAVVGARENDPPNTQSTQSIQSSTKSSTKSRRIPPLDHQSSNASSSSSSSRAVQLLRDYEMATSILEARNRAFRSAPGGRARVVLDDDVADVRRSLRAVSEAYLHEPVLPTSDLSASSRDDDDSSGGTTKTTTTTTKKKKSVSFQDESSRGATTPPHAELSSSSRRHHMDHARCNDDEAGPGNGHATSPIHAACFKGDHLVATHLLSFYHAADAAKLVNSTCSCGMTPLQVACDQGHAKVAKLLLKRQARVNKRSSASASGPSGSPPRAAPSMGFSMVGMGKKRHRSCLALASARRSAEIVELLLAYGAHVDEDALVTASSQGDAAVVRLLLQSQKKSGGGGLAKLWGSASSAAASSAAAGEIDASWISNAAAIAVANEHPGVLPVLLGDGTSSESRARVVSCAIEATSLADYKLLRCLTKLYDHALLTATRDAHQNSLLHLAVRQASARCVTLLIRLGVDVNARDALRITPLYVACARGQSAIAKLLVNAGAACEAMGPNDETPLHIAAQENQLSCVQILLSDGCARVDGTTLDKCTALHLACQRGNTAVAKCLLDHGADINARTVCDETPLLKASRMSNLETVKLLLARDAEIATSSTSSISSCESGLRSARAGGAEYSHTASTASSVFSTNSSVRSAADDAFTHSGRVSLVNNSTSTASTAASNATSTSSSNASRRRAREQQKKDARPHALLQRLAEHQLPRRASSDEEAAAASSSSDHIFLAKSNSHKSFKGWLKSVVKSK